MGEATEPIRVRFEYTMEDLVGAYRLVGGWGRHIAYAGVFAAMAVVIVAQGIHLGRSELLFLAPFVGVIPVLIILVGRSSTIGRLRAAHPAGEHEMSFGGKGVVHRSPKEEGLIPWSEFEGLREGADVYVLYKPNWQPLVIPLRAFRSPEELDSLRALIWRGVYGREPPG